MRDLWPEDFAVTPEAKTPATILREQAAFLGQKTNNVVEAKVVPSGAIYPGGFVYNFFIVAPVLDNYMYKLFTIAYNINLYPISLDVGMEIHTEIDPEYQRYLEVKIITNSESEFVDLLGKIFCTEKTKKVIGTLLSMSREG